MKLHELPIRLVRPLSSKLLPGHDPIADQAEISLTARTIYRSGIKPSREVAAEKRRDRIVARIQSGHGHIFRASGLQISLGISKTRMHSDLKVLREAHRVGSRKVGMGYEYFAL